MGYFGKLFSGTVVVILVTALVVYVSSLHVLEDQVHHETSSRVERESRLVALAVARAWDPVEASCDLQLLRDAAAGLQGSRVTLIARDGKVLFDSHKDAASMDNHLGREEVTHPGRLVTRFSHTLQKEMLYCARAVVVGGEQVAWARVAQSIQDRNDELRALNAAVRNGVLLAALIALVLAALIARQLTRPLREIGEFVAEVGRGETQRRIPAMQGKEIGQLAETVNQMTDALEEKIARIQRDKAEREAILSGIDDGLIALDTEQRILFINSPARAMLEVPPGRPKGLALADLTGNADLERVMRESSATDEPVRAETLLAAPDGERRLELSAVPLPGEGGCRRGSVLVLRDVTELRHLEAVRRDFVSNVSHELKTPLTAMRGYVEAILDDEGMTPEQRTSFLEKARQNTERLTSIVSDLLSLSRLESEERELCFEPLEVREVVDEVLQDCHDLAQSRQVSLEVELEGEGAGALARADAQALHMALSNLVTNAVQYSPPETGEVRVRLGASGDEVFIDVRDNGPGIPAAEQERIFERFYRVDKARSRRLGGTGLGLSIVRHVMAAHGGRVELESREGEGSRFRLVLPRVG